jgi:hypothetical protein
MKKTLTFVIVIFVLLALSASAVGCFPSTSVIKRIDDKNTDKNGNNDNDDNDDEDLNRALLVSLIRVLITGIDSPEKFLGALSKIISMIDPDEIVDLVGNYAGDEAARLIGGYIEDYRPTIDAALFILQNKAALQIFIGVLGQIEAHPELASTYLYLAGVTKNGDVYTYDGYYGHYVLTVLGENGYSFSDGENEYALEIAGENNYIITEGGKEYNISYSAGGAGAAVKQADIALYTAESVKSGEDLALQYYDFAEGRLVQIYFDTSELLATISVSEGAYQTIIGGLPSGFATGGLVFRFTPSDSQIEALLELFGANEN